MSHNSIPSSSKPLVIVHNAFDIVASQTPALHTKEFAKASQTVKELYNCLFGHGSILANQLNQDLEAHVQEVLHGLEYFPQNQNVDMFTMLSHEIKLIGGGQNASKSNSGAVALWGTVWLVRILDFVSKFCHTLATNPNTSPRQCAKDAYDVTLRRFHSFFVGGIVKTGMNMVTDKQHLLNSFGYIGQNAEEDAKKELMACHHAIHKTTTTLREWIQKTASCPMDM